ncbi:MAG: hypothetical protein PHO70_07275 [Candidatus Omnitrophica bacterium]|nr:hypothetical protein [Candidatus Omnitrophota bacterium]
MDENAKNKVIIILSVLTVIFFLGSISSCSSSFRNKSERDKEMAKRLDSEEKLNKFNQERITFSDQIKSKDKELEEEKAATQAMKKALVQEQLVNESLKEELEKVTKVKEALEEDLKDALTAKKTTKPKK